jgi:N6-L-threonylcarbamoyladenine synthase
MKKFTVLGIETSCDETSVALLDFDFKSKIPKVRIKKHVVSSQMDIHAKYGGVVPEVAARTHVPETVSLLTSQLKKKDPLTSFDAIAVSKGPGLATALRVGIQAAATLAWTSGKPLVGVNHLEGHIASAWLVPENRKKWKFPALALLVSGGHTELVLMKDFCKYKILGSTRDDAAGEAFDKSAKLLGLGYPGGPKISKHAEGGNDKAYDFPRPMINDPSLDMSFSGLKTAIRNAVMRECGSAGKKKISAKKIHDLCASIEAAIVDVLIAKTIKAAKKHPVKSVLLVGGVSANKRLRSDLAKAVRLELPGVTMLKPVVGLATDNAAMVAAAGAWHLLKGESHDWKKMDAEPELDL